MRIDLIIDDQGHWARDETQNLGRMVVSGDGALAHGQHTTTL